MIYSHEHLIFQCSVGLPEGRTEAEIEEHLRDLLEQMREREYTRLDVESVERGYVGSVGFGSGYIAMYYDNRATPYVQYDIVRREELDAELFKDLLTAYWHGTDVEAWKVMREVGRNLRYRELS